ncbi:uncharacterized protein LOC26527859 [Drosophila mojavensis]|uniref:Uncharacterized protein n=1 Tax=Drosophila mojavensis TaxID=7230 RepID=A0A0Q9X1M1_DROMO|nr:uncharacterized protein LOC26527859 [Drosophila mojavensis]KRG01821.1 uncharacterized protein Dmoj_GI26218 [Drosophila mojavensis]
MARGRLYIVYFISLFVVTLQGHIRCKPPPRPLSVDDIPPIINAINNVGGVTKHLRESDINELTDPTKATVVTEATQLTNTTDINETTVLNEITDLNKTTESTKRKPRRLRNRIPKKNTFLRNPNYISINKKLEKLAKSMYILELPLPAPGAKGGSSRGCDHFEVIQD